MIRIGRYGIYGGKKCFFTHRNPKNGDVWSDDIAITYHTPVGVRVEYGKWVASDKVKWL